MSLFELLAAFDIVVNSSLWNNYFTWLSVHSLSWFFSSLHWMLFYDSSDSFFLSPKSVYSGYPRDCTFNCFSSPPKFRIRWSHLVLWLKNHIYVIGSQPYLSSSDISTKDKIHKCNSELLILKTHVDLKLTHLKPNSYYLPTNVLSSIVFTTLVYGNSIITVA